MQIIRRITRNLGIIGLTFLLITLAQTSVFAYSGQQVTVREDIPNEFVITLTVPLLTVPGEQFPVHIQGKSLDPTAFCTQWALYEDDVYVAGNGFAPLEFSVIVTRTASVHHYYAKGRSIGGAHGWPPYAFTDTLSTHEDMHEGTVPSYMLVENTGKDSKTSVRSSVVDVGSGNLNLDYQLTRIIPTNDLLSNFTLYYNSLDVEYDWPDNIRPLGPNWTHTFNQCITRQANTIIYIASDGRRTFYQDTNNDNVFESLSVYGSYSVVTDTGSEFILTQRDKTQLTFNGQGHLSEIKDRNNNLVTLLYTGSDLTTIRLAPNGRTSRDITIGYSVGLISTITDPAGNTSNIYYTNGLLTSFSSPGNATWSFTYKTGTNLVETVLSPIASTSDGMVGFSYGAVDNKVTSVTRYINGTSYTSTFGYDTINNQTTITNYDGNAFIATYNYDLTSWDNKTDESGYTYNIVLDDNRNVLTRTNARNISTSYEYDPIGNLTCITDALGYTTLYQYGDSANPYLATAIIDALGVTTSYTYDASGNMTRKIETVGTSVEQRTDYTYDLDGRLSTETKDPLGINILTEYHYDTYGYVWKKIVDPSGLNITSEYLNNIVGWVGTAYKPYTANNPKGPYTSYQYDSRGNVTYITDSYGVITKFNYNLTDELTYRTDDYGLKNIVSKYDYDGFGRLKISTVDYGTGTLNITSTFDYYPDNTVQKATDSEGATTEYFYYPNGWVEYAKNQITDTGYAYTYYYYDTTGNVTNIIDPMGHTTTYTYTVLDRLDSTIGPENNVITYGYNAVGLLTTLKDARNNIASYSYDELRRLKSIRTPEANITTVYVYDKTNRVVQIIGPWYDNDQSGTVNGSESANYRYYGYDKADRVINTSINAHPQTVFAYDLPNDRINITDPVGLITEIQYDNKNRWVLVTADPSGLNERIACGYDSLGRQTVVTSAYGTTLATTTYSEYDNAGRLTYIKPYINDIAYATKYEYNQRGQVLKVYDAEGLATNPQYYTEYRYNKAGWLNTVINALGYATEYEYDLDGLRTSITYYRDTAPIYTYYTYYKNHLLKTTTLPGFSGTNTTTYWYDGNGNLTAKTDANGNTISYTYDANNRLAGKTYPSVESVAYTYDANSNVLTVQDNYTNTVNQYDDLNRLITTTDNTYTPAKVIGYSYYEDGLRSSMNTSVESVAYTYDKAKRLKTVKRNSAAVGTYYYNALGLRTQLTYGNNAFTQYGYNTTTRWLTSVVNKRWTAHNIIASSFTYTHDKVGNRKTMALYGGDVVTYTYNSIYQLTNEVRTGSTPYSISWTYDKVGNRLTQTKNSVLTNYQYNDANQLISDTSLALTNTYQYDSNGNMITKTQGANIWTWGYDFENRQTAYTDYQNSANNAIYIYDTLNRRTGKQVGGTFERYVYDGPNSIADYNSSNNLIATYITPFLDDNLYVNRLVDGSWQTFYYMHDGLGSVSNLISTSQVLKKNYQYNAFGEMLSETGTDLPNRFKFTGREWDNESQTYYYRTRQYNPASGRFTQRDPIGYRGGLNIYSYCGSNPVNWIDPWGWVAKWPQDVGGGATTLPYFPDYDNPQPSMAQTLPYIIDYSKPPDESMYQLMGFAEEATGWILVGIGVTVAVATAPSIVGIGAGAIIAGIGVGILEHEAATPVDKAREVTDPLKELPGIKMNTLQKEIDKLVEQREHATSQAEKDEIDKKIEQKQKELEELQGE
ncbi:MAG: RHS repeat-associated core domain-containing protein [Planctomycetota bacterium]